MKQLHSLIFLLSFSSALQAKDETKTFQSGTKQVSLLELFSSEGCNSCPPAEKSLYNLTEDKEIWKNFVPVNFHVDYWNRLGWNDRFSKDKFTQRQRQYATLWDKSHMYTPDFVLNGKDTGTTLPTEINQQKTNLAGDLKVSVTKSGKIHVEYSPSSAENKKYDLTIAILGNGLESKVTAGENKGATLEHNFVVLDLEAIEAKKNKNMWSADFTKASVSAEAKTLSVAAWVSEHDSIIPIQAAGGNL